MSPIVDPNKLKDIAQTAVTEAAKKEAEFKREERAERKKMRELAIFRAEEIIASIPTELEKVAQKLEKTPPDMKLAAEIPIVREKFHSIMDSCGDLDEEDEIVLKTVKKRLETLSLPGVDKITIQKKTKEGGYMAADGDTTYGPCKHYYLVVEVTLPK